MMLGAPLFDRGQKIDNHLAARPCTEIALAVDSDADGLGVHVAFSDHEHAVDFRLFGALDLPGI